jgi:hypothetical protein
MVGSEEGKEFQEETKRTLLVCYVCVKEERIHETVY